MNRNPAPAFAGVKNGQGPRPLQVVNCAEGADTGLRRYGEKN